MSLNMINGLKSTKPYDHKETGIFNLKQKIKIEADRDIIAEFVVHKYAKNIYKQQLESCILYNFEA